MGIRRRLLNFIIGATWEGAQETARAKADIKDLETGTKSAGTGGAAALGQIAGAAALAGTALTGAAVAAKAAWEGIREGSAMVALNQQLHQATGNTYQFTESLKTALKSALQGTVTDARATELALKAIENGAEGIAEITREVIKLAEAEGLLAQGARTAKGEFEAQTVAAKNYIDTVKQTAAVQLATTFGGGGTGGFLDKQIEEQQRYIQLQTRLNALVGSGVTTYGDYKQIQKDIAVLNFEEAETAIKQAEAKRDLATAISAVDIKLGQYIGYAAAAQGASARLTGSVLDLRDALAGLNTYQQLNYLSNYGGPYATPGRLAGGREGKAAAAQYSQAIVMSKLSGAAAMNESRQLRAVERAQAEAEAVEETTGAYGRYINTVQSAEEAVSQLAAQTGSLFDQARRMDEFNPAEFFYKQLLEKGASAGQLRDALITSGLESPERANEIFNLAQRMQAITNIADQTVAGGIPVSMGWQAAQATADTIISGQYAGATINQGGYAVTVNFNGDVIDPDEITELIDQHLQKAYAAAGGTP